MLQKIQECIEKYDVAISVTITKQFVNKTYYFSACSYEILVNALLAFRNI